MKAALSAVDPKKVKGIGISGQQHGFVPLDKQGGVCTHHLLTPLVPKSNVSTWIYP